MAGLLGTLAVGASLSGTRARAQDATYRVYPAPVESPLYTTPLPPADARVLVADPASATASPFGWHDTDGASGPEFTTTQGNNALVFFDADGDGTPDPGETADGGPTLAFDFPIDLTAPPATYAAAVVTNLFYWTNYVHDVFFHYGFDEAAGNFQATNYGGGGGEGDAVLVRMTEGGSFNVNMFTPPDGVSPRLTLTLPASGPPAEAFNNGVFIHQLAHGLSTRLTGSPSTVSCLQNAEQMGEGWSDWYALMLTQRPGDTRTDPRTGPSFPPAPYTTDFAVNDFTHGDIATASVPHGVGFVWATALWEVTWDLIDALGFSPDLTDGDGTAGNQIALRLITEGLKRQPCAPGFVDGRDAILTADATLYGGAHADLLWAAFARRGLGFSADQGSSNATTDNTEAFDFPPTTAGEPEAVTQDLVFESVPNPTSGAATVTYVLDRSGPARLAVYDVRGRELAVVAAGPRPAGRHTAHVDTRGWPPGTYVLRLETGSAVQTRLMTVVR